MKLAFTFAYVLDGNMTSLCVCCWLSVT